MNNEAFKRHSTLGWGCAVLVIGFALFSISLITVPAIRWQITSLEFRSNMDTSPLPADWRWSGVLIADLGILLILGYLASQPIIQILTKFTNEAIEQPAFFRKKRIRWHDVQKVHNITTANIEISDATTKINLNPNLFLHAHDLIAELRSRIPSSVFPTDEQILQEKAQHHRSDIGRSTIGALIFGILILIIGKDMVAYFFGLLILGYGVFQFRKWSKLGCNP